MNRKVAEVIEMSAMTVCVYVSVHRLAPTPTLSRLELM